MGHRLPKLSSAQKRVARHVRDSTDLRLTEAQRRVRAEWDRIVEWSQKHAEEHRTWSDALRAGADRLVIWPYHGSNREEP